MRPTYLTIFLLVFLAACGSDSSDANDQAERLAKVRLQCEYLGESEGIPRYAVYALLDENKVKLAELPACDTILPADYAAKGIPKTAITAVGGWWAGQGDYIYAQAQDGVLRLHIGGIGEESPETTPVYSALAEYDGERFQLLRPLHPADLAGYYVHQGQDTSFVLFLGLKGPQLIAKIFATAEALPPQKVLQRALPAFATTPEVAVDCDLNSLSFLSELGQGHIFWRQDTASVTFTEFMGAPSTRVFELIQH